MMTPIRCAQVGAGARPKISPVARLARSRRGAWRLVGARLGGRVGRRVTFGRVGVLYRPRRRSPALAGVGSNRPSRSWRYSSGQACMSRIETFQPSSSCSPGRKPTETLDGMPTAPSSPSQTRTARNTPAILKQEVLQRLIATGEVARCCRELAAAQICLDGGRLCCWSVGLGCDPVGQLHQKSGRSDGMTAVTAASAGVPATACSDR